MFMVSGEITYFKESDAFGCCIPENKLQSLRLNNILKQHLQGHIHWVNNNTSKINLLAMLVSPEYRGATGERLFYNHSLDNEQR